MQKEINIITYDDLYINASNYFSNNYYDTFRFDLYSDNTNTRKLIDSDLDKNSKDIETIINYFQNNYEEIYLVGHSLGATAIINSDTSNVNKIILWDPSGGLSKKEENNDISYNEKKGNYIVNRGVKFEINKKFKNQWSDTKKIEKYINKILNNTYFIFAGNSEISNNWKKFINNYVIIKDANHPFDGNKIQKELFNKTLSYLSS